MMPASKTTSHGATQREWKKATRPRARSAICHTKRWFVTGDGSQTTKRRLVFDASSSAGGRVSLNGVLESGPHLNPGLIVLLIRFRTHNIAVIADIEKAFLQVSFSESDRSAVRFL